jgi:DNA-nicking Smr family endonuclease
MSRGGGKSGTTGRHVTPDEAELWSCATSSLAKVRAKPRVTTHAPVAPPAPPRPPAAETKRARSRPTAATEAAGGQPVAATGRQAVPLPEFDRRSLRQVATGKVAIDARLDLHGLQRGEAHARLRAFLLDSQARGHRMVLVITGKGAGVETADHLASSLGRAERGILRRSVPEWLQEPELRAAVIGYATAGPRHGGEGALYVRLRKAQKT